MTQATIDEYIRMLQQEMEAHRDPKKAQNMSAYLKNKFDCLGIKSPVRNEIQKRWFTTIKPLNFNHFDVVAHLWNLPEREYQYVAVDYLKKTAKKKISKDDFKILEELITTKSWWETVDLLSSNYVGNYFKKFPEQVEPVISRWRNSDNFWLHRTCLIFQLKYKESTDFELMKSLILQFRDNNEFFIQKAIGWCLRQYSKFDPEAVKAFIEEAQLEGLAKREASKYL